MYEIHTMNAPAIQSSHVNPQLKSSYFEQQESLCLILLKDPLLTKLERDSKWHSIKQFTRNSCSIAHIFRIQWSHLLLNRSILVY